MSSAKVPTLSGKERLVLELLLGSSAKYGLELVDESRGGLKRGTIYVTLGRMEQKGLVTSQQEPDARHPDALIRRMYRATAHGQRVYEVWTTVARSLSAEPAR